MEANKRALRHSNVPPRLSRQARNHKHWRAGSGVTRAAGTGFYLSQLMGAVHGFPIVIWTPAAKRDTMKRQPPDSQAATLPPVAVCHYGELQAATSYSQYHPRDWRVPYFPIRQVGPSLLGYHGRVCTVPLGQIPVDEMFDFYLTTSFSSIPVPVTRLSQGSPATAGGTVPPPAQPACRAAALRRRPCNHRCRAQPGPALRYQEYRCCS